MDSQNDNLRGEIDSYYRRQQLTEAILHKGKIPYKPEETFIGVAFLDIVDYSYLSRYLTPRENLILLNGLYTALHIIVNSHNGYLNKIQGDSMMFQFGGPIDNQIEMLNSEDARYYIVQTLFRTCVEIQTACRLFNEADDRFIQNASSESQKQALRTAFDIVESWQQQKEMNSKLMPDFQINIRIGASIGEVTFGNTGPPGAKQWDVIGNPVIEAKRMESTAPAGGFRISESMYSELAKFGVVDSYCEEFRLEAQLKSSQYRDILDTEIFKYQSVVIKHKSDVRFATYSVQVETQLPNQVSEKIISLLFSGTAGANRAVDTILKFRGNKYVMQAVEATLQKMGINLHKEDLLRIVYPKKYKQFAQKYANTLPEQLNKDFTLYNIFEYLSKYQDEVSQIPVQDSEYPTFQNYEMAMEAANEFHEQIFESSKFYLVQQSYFYSYVFPMLRVVILNSILEYQNNAIGHNELLPSISDMDSFELEEFTELEMLDSPNAEEMIAQESLHKNNSAGLAFNRHGVQ